MSIARLNARDLTGARLRRVREEPERPQMGQEPALALYRKIVRRQDPRGKPADVYNWYSMTVAWTMVETIRKAGERRLRGSVCCGRAEPEPRGGPYLLPGIVLKTSKTRYFPSTRSTSTGTTTGSGSRQVRFSTHAGSLTARSITNGGADP